MKIVFVLLAAVLVTGGCASSSPGSAPTVVPTTELPAPSSGSASTVVPTTELPAPSRPAAGALTVTGTVGAGVEGGCIVLDRYLLIFEDPALKAKAVNGAKVVVTGKADPGMMTTCQQGTPLLVTGIRPA